jgi:hypothetical protein
MPSRLGPIASASLDCAPDHAVFKRGDGNIEITFEKRRV